MYIQIGICTGRQRIIQVYICALDTKDTYKIRVEFNALLHKKKKFPETTHLKYPYRCFPALPTKNPVPELKWKLILKKSWRIWVDHHNWINMLQKLQATSTSFLSWQLSFGILQTKHKWFDCNMWNIWPSYPWQSVRCRGDLITVVKFITASLIQRTNKKHRSCFNRNRARINVKWHHLQGKYRKRLHWVFSKQHCNHMNRSYWCLIAKYKLEMIKIHLVFYSTITQKNQSSEKNQKASFSNWECMIYRQHHLGRWEINSPKYCNHPSYGSRGHWSTLCMAPTGNWYCRTCISQPWEVLEACACPHSLSHTSGLVNGRSGRD